MGARDYLFLFIYFMLAAASAIFLYNVGLRRWIGKLRHPRGRRYAMALWGIGIFGLLESSYWWPELGQIMPWPLSNIIPLPVFIFFVVWAVALILIYQRALRPVTAQAN